MQYIPDGVARTLALTNQASSNFYNTFSDLARNKREQAKTLFEMERIRGSGTGMDNAASYLHGKKVDQRTYVDSFGNPVQGEDYGSIRDQLVQNSQLMLMDRFKKASEGKSYFEKIQLKRSLQAEHENILNKDLRDVNTTFGRPNYQDSYYERNQIRGGGGDGRGGKLIQAQYVDPLTGEAKEATISDIEASTYEGRKKWAEKQKIADYKDENFGFSGDTNPLRNKETAKKYITEVSQTIAGIKNNFNNQWFNITDKEFEEANGALSAYGYKVIDRGGKKFEIVPDKENPNYDKAVAVNRIIEKNVGTTVNKKQTAPMSKPTKKDFY